MSLIRPGQTYARYSNIKPRACIRRPVNEKNEQRKSDGGFAEPWVDEPSTWKCSSVLSIGDNAAPPSIDPLTQDSLEFRFFADAKVDRHGDIEI